METKKILRKAKDYIDDKGWINQATIEWEGPCCIIQAITRVSDEDDPVGEALSLFRKANKINSIIKWNDSIAKSKEEVLEAFDKAIKYEDFG